MTFEPVATTLSVGTHVEKGQQFGTVSEYRDGSMHCDKSCVHWGVLRGDGNYLDLLERVYKKK
ncbi:MAG: hypothetical protein LBP35_00305 [Candidatus Ancillula trichonymphae]|nr:hypothetical protein [Candidatus Ancillula trichonymphae]